MIGGAPKPEVDRLATTEQAHLARTTAETSPAPAISPMAPHNEQHSRDGGNEATALAESPSAVDEYASPANESREVTAPGTESGTPATAEQAEAAPFREGETPEAGAEAAQGPKDPERFRFQNAEDRAVAQIAKAKGISLVDAARIYAGPAVAGAQQQAQAALGGATPEGQAAAGPATAASPQVAQWEQNVADIERRLEACGAREGLWNPQAAALVRQHSKAAASLEVARLAAVHQAAAAQAFDAQRDAALADAVKQYPDLGNSGSALWKVAAQLAREAHDSQHPDHLPGQQTDAPRYFAGKAATLLRVRAVPSALPPGAASAAGKAPLRVGPASGTKQTLPPSPAQTEQQRIAAAHAKTLAMLGGKPGKYDDDPGNAFLVM